MRSWTLAVLIVLGGAPPALACTDAGPCDGGRCGGELVPWDAGPGCSVVPADASCGPALMVVCEPTDAGPHDAGTDAPYCTPFRDTGIDGPSGERWPCTSNADCPASVPGLTCGASGTCECAPDDTGGGGGGCSIGHGAPRSAWLGVVLLALFAFARRGARGRSLGG